MNCFYCIERPLITTLSRPTSDNTFLILRLQLFVEIKRLCNSFTLIKKNIFALHLNKYTVFLKIIFILYFDSIFFITKIQFLYQGEFLYELNKVITIVHQLNVQCFLRKTTRVFCFFFLVTGNFK